MNADTIAAGLSAFRPELVAFAAGQIMLVRMHELARGAEFRIRNDFGQPQPLALARELQRDGYDVHLLFLWLRQRRACGEPASWSGFVRADIISPRKS